MFSIKLIVQLFVRQSALNFIISADISFSISADLAQPCSRGQKFKTIFLSATFLRMTRSNSTALLTLLSWSLYRSNFHVDFQFICFSIAEPFCYDITAKSVELLRISLWFFWERMWPKNCVTRLNFALIYVQLISMLCLQNIDNPQRV